MKRQRPRHGFFLIELLILLGILGLIALAGGHLFNTTIRLGHSAAEAANAAASFDAMLAALRSDAWSAGDISISADGTVATLKPPGSAAPIVWTVGGSTISRTDAGQTRSWPVAAGSTLGVDGPSLVLRMPATKHVLGGEARVTSQVLLLSRRSP